MTLAAVWPKLMSLLDFLSRLPLRLKTVFRNGFTRPRQMLICAEET